MKDLTLNNVLTYIGIFIVSLFVLYMLRSLFLTQRGLIEGLTNNSNTNTNSNNNNNQVMLSNIDVNELQSLIKKYKDLNMQSKPSIDSKKTDYEDLIIALDEYIDYMCIGQLYSLNLPPKNDKDWDKIQKINQLHSLKQNLNASMDFLDKQ